MINVEQEFKTLLSSDQAARLQECYPFAPAFTQTNHYFDTYNNQLRQAGCGLRIRQLADHSEQTLKVAAGPNRRLLEYTDKIDGNTLVLGGQVAAELQRLGIDWQALQPFAEATTNRRLSPQPAGLLTLDHTHYPDGFSDWEVELEYQDAEAANSLWQVLLNQLHLIKSQPVNKILRAKIHRKA